MIRLLSFLWEGCWHHWKEDSRDNLTMKHYDDYIDLGIQTRGVRVHCTCTRCGKPKKFDLI